MKISGRSRLESGDFSFAATAVWQGGGKPFLPCRWVFCPLFCVEAGRFFRFKA